MSESANGNDENDKPIPYINTDNKNTDNKPDIYSDFKQKKSPSHKIVFLFTIIVQRRIIKEYLLYLLLFPWVITVITVTGLITVITV